MRAQGPGIKRKSLIRKENENEKGSRSRSRGYRPASGGGVAGQFDAEIEATLAEIEPADRILVTNHEVFGYFAERYDFEVVGTVIPAGTTSEAASGGDLSDLADTIRDEGVSAIFVETSSPDRLAATLAAEVGDVAVVELFAESLGEDGSTADTYEGMMRENAHRIVAALA